MRARLIALSLCVALPACTTQMSGLAPGVVGSEPALVNGVSYRLARLDYSATLTRTLTKCPDEKGSPLEIEVSASVAPTYAPSEEVIVDYAKLANGWKTTNISFETYPNGVLKSVNAQVSDQTGPAIKAGAGALVGIAKLALGVPSIPAGASTAFVADGSKPVGALLCTKQTKAELATLEKLETARDKLAKTQSEAKTDLDAFDADHIGAPLTDLAKAEHLQKAKTLRTATENAKTALDAYAKQRQKLSVQTIEPIATDGPLAIGKIRKTLLTPGLDVGALYAGLFEIVITQDGKVVGDKLKVPASLNFRGATLIDVAAQAALKSLIDRSTITATLQQTAIALSAPGIAVAESCGSGEKQTPCGLLYRSVTPIRLQLCRYSVDLVDCGTLPAGHALILVRDERNAPQLGGLRSLPLKNGPFETNSLVATFREDSTLATMTYAKPTAGGVVALGALGDVVAGANEIDAYNRGKGLRRTQNATALAKAQSDLATAQALAFEAEQKRRDAQAKLDALNETEEGSDQ